MTSERASVFNQGPDLDISGFAPRASAKPAPQPEKVKAVSESASFVSREPARLPERLRGQSNLQSEGRDTQNLQHGPVPRSAAQHLTREPRRHRTGRNIQFNIKARGDVIERFYALADRNGWVLGETFERAVAALERAGAN